MVIITPSVDEKLESFNRMILKDATASRDDVLDNLRKDTEIKLEASKAAIDREITEVYNREITKAVQQKESLISKAKVNTRKSIIAVRNEIMTSVIAELTERFRAFTESPDYEPWLMKNIDDAMALVAPEAGQLHLTQRDFDLYRRQISLRFPNLALFAADSGMMGGCRAKAPNKNLFVDNSIENKIDCCRGELFSISAIKLSDN